MPISTPILCLSAKTPAIAGSILWAATDPIPFDANGAGEIKASDGEKKTAHRVTEKAVYVEVKILYLCLPQEVRKEFLALAADSSIWNSKDRTGVGNYPNAMKYMNKEETKRKRSEMAEKYGLKLVKNQIYYSSPELLNKAYEAMKNIPFEE